MRHHLRLVMPACGLPITQIAESRDPIDAMDALVELGALPEELAEPWAAYEEACRADREKAGRKVLLERVRELAFYEDF